MSCVESSETVHIVMAIYCDIIFPSTDSEWSYLQSTMKLINMHNFQFYPAVTSPSNEQEGS